MRILVTPTSFTAQSSHAAARRLGEFADQLIFNPHGRPLASKELIPLMKGIDGYVAGLDWVDAEAINQAPQSLKVIARYGAGYDRVDIAAAAKKGIAVTNTPGANSEAVADMTLGLMLAAGRMIPRLSRQVKQGEWPRFKGSELYGKTLGIVGLGEIGRRVAKRASGFSMRVLVCDPFLDPNFAKRERLKRVELETLLRESDVISLHSPLLKETRGMIGQAQVMAMKPGVLIINTARAELCSEKALVFGLEQGIIGGLGLDVFTTEPPDDNPLLKYERVVCTPHAAAHSHEATERMADMAVDSLIQVLTGKACPYLVNQPKAES
jgi:D-3-phosphoglycerate dehydrogenase